MAQKLEALHLEAICEAVRKSGARLEGMGLGAGDWGQGGGFCDRGPALLLQNIETWMKDKSEVEVVDLVLKLREKLVSSVVFGLPCPATTTWQEVSCL